MLNEFASHSPVSKYGVALANFSSGRGWLSLWPRVGGASPGPLEERGALQFHVSALPNKADLGQQDSSELVSF